MPSGHLLLMIRLSMPAKWQCSADLCCKLRHINKDRAIHVLLVKSVGINALVSCLVRHTAINLSACRDHRTQLMSRRWVIQDDKGKVVDQVAGPGESGGSACTPVPYNPCWSHYVIHNACLHFMCKQCYF